MKLIVERPDGSRFTFEGDASELANVAAKLAAHKLDAEPAKQQESEFLWTEHKVSAAVKYLWGEQLKLVRFVLSRGGCVSYHELGKHMGYSGQRLAGVLSSITRNTKKATQHDKAKLIGKHFSEHGNLRYFIDAQVIKHLKAAIGGQRDAHGKI